jgi:RimJ/RimL family protein N-acetyltransferase
MVILRVLQAVSYKRFKAFLNSLNEEYDSWSLDLQTFKDDKEFYEGTAPLPVGCIVSIDADTNKIVGLCDIYSDVSEALDGALFMISFVVKKEYQSMGIGSQMLLTIENLLMLRGAEYIAAKHFKDNVASHKAFLKAGYKEWIYTKNYYLSDGTPFLKPSTMDTKMDWKIKYINKDHNGNPVLPWEYKLDDILRADPQDWDQSATDFLDKELPQ